MNSYRQILYHIVFCTYNHENALPETMHEDLYRYIWGIVKKRNCVLYRVNSTENHIHILSDLHSSISLADYIKEIKTATNRWIKESRQCPSFISWADGYCALTYTYRDKEMILNYIKNQKEHHKKTNFEDEYKALLKEFGIEADEKYIF
ncbi:IS200/IS605 family transposase [Paludibacter sp.]|uniref:IS200/IS605 family transposase n=1 Tax=Paludibacter sp. TaxID=1898105 RepID=UPI001353F70F|nr:IS200/IS605 family transposase [Paludibacter sp.]MTK53359.1 IS200/IS605 family transposase [Paludibacter sp.]